ncbi:phage/plasmid-associated DNA primase [Pantoea agglomerans]
MPLSTPNVLFIGHANIRPINPKRYLYHTYLSFMESRGHQHPLSLTAFGRAVQQTLKEYERVLLKRRTNNGVQTNLTLHEDSEADCLPVCSV